MQAGDQVVQCLTGVEDVVQQEDVVSANIGECGRVDREFAGGCRLAPVAGGLDEVDAQAQVEVSHQVGQKHQTTGQDADNGYWTILIIPGDLNGHFGDTLLQALGGQ